MINNYLCYRDFETCSLNPQKTQPIEWAAVMIDPKRLNLVKNSAFISLMKPELDDDKAIELGLDPVEEDALRINHKTRDELAKAPSPKVVWQQYQKYLKRYNLKGENGPKQESPIPCGFNSRDFDDIIEKRLTDKHGPKLDSRGEWTYYNTKANFDLHDFIQMVFLRENIGDFNSYSMDSCRDFFGYSKDRAHDALCDVIQGADLLIRMLKLNKALTNGTLVVNKKAKVKFKHCVTDEDNLRLDRIIENGQV